jgi:ribonuclease J
VLFAWERGKNLTNNKKHGGKAAGGEQAYLKFHHAKKDKIPTVRANVPKLKVIPLGGLGEIGKNITVLEYENDIIIIDCGIAFPDEEMLGVDLVLPDITYLLRNKEKIRGVFITHGHEDHVGGLPYFLRQINVPVYGTKLTLGIATGKLKEHKLLKEAQLKTVSVGNVVKTGAFKVEFIGVNHSIPDACALAIRTPVGTVFHTGDFKLDTAPIVGDMMDIARISQIGKEKVLLLMSESTNVEREGYSKNERSITSSFAEIFKDSSQRIIVATFASNVHRVQQIIDAAVRFGRKVAISGRSMENIVNVATELGYAKIPKTSLIGIDDIGKYPPEKLVLITTGSQGEPMSALARMAFSDHKKVVIGPGDLVLISSNPIPGNERYVARVVNELFRRGASVIYDDIHVSGHAFQEELKLMIKLINPKFFIPVHGEYRHLKLHYELAKKMGIKPANMFVLDNGQTLELDSETAKLGTNVPSGKVYVDGLGVGDVGNIVLRDRKHLAQDGLIVVVMTLSEDGQVVAGPDIISRGFIYIREAEDLMEATRKHAKNALETCIKHGTKDWNTIKVHVRDALGEFLYSKTKRKPMILSVIMEV